MLTTLLFFAFGCAGCGTEITADSTSGPVDAHVAPIAVRQVTAWGDSLTAGNMDGSGVTFPKVLSSLAGETVINLGIGAQTSSQIAVRMNAYAGSRQQTFATGFTIPTSGSVSVTFQPGFEPVNTHYRPAYPNGVRLSFVVAGETYSGNVIETGTTYVFSPIQYPSEPVAVPADTAWTAVNPSNINSGCVILWAGRNNPYKAPKVLADLAAMVAVVRQSTDCYVVLSIPNNDSPAEWKGSDNYNAILAVNSALSAAYSPGNHFLDIRSALVAAYNPNNPADVLDHENDVPPYSLRAQNVRGLLTSPISSPTSCAISTLVPLVSGQIISLNREKIQILGGGNGAYNCIRGYAGTTANTSSSGAYYTGVDSEHPGQNSTSAANPRYTNGNELIAAQVYAWLMANTHSQKVPPRDGPDQEPYATSSAVSADGFSERE